MGPKGKIYLPQKNTKHLAKKAHTPFVNGLTGAHRTCVQKNQDPSPKKPRELPTLDTFRPFILNQPVRYTKRVLLYRTGISIFLCSLALPEQPVPGGAPFHAPRSPSWTAAPLRLPGTPRAEGCRVGRAWRGRAAARGRVAIGRDDPPRGETKNEKKSFQDPKRRHYYYVCELNDIDMIASRGRV